MWGKLCFDYKFRLCDQQKNLNLNLKKNPESSALVLALMFKSHSTLGEVPSFLWAPHLRCHPGVSLPNVWARPGLDPRTT